MAKNDSRVTTTSNKLSNPVLKTVPALAPSRPQGQGPAPAVSKEQIARRAYEKFVARGGAHGNHEQDWLEAERELQSQARRTRSN